MGLSFKKELTLGEVQVFPENNKIGEQPTRLQERLLRYNLHGNDMQITWV